MAFNAIEKVLASTYEARTFDKLLCKNVLLSLVSVEAALEECYESVD